MRVVLTGMKHCGKTTAGKLLAKFMHCRFVDTDDLVESYYRDIYGEKLNCREIFTRHGTEFFRKLELETVSQLQTELKPESWVVGLGGGLPMNPPVRAILPQLGTLVYLKVEPEIIFRRIQANGLPPFIDPSRPFESFMEFFSQREKIYEEIADLSVICPGGNTPEQNLEKIIRELGIKSSINI